MSNIFYDDEDQNMLDYSIALEMAIEEICPEEMVQKIKKRKRALLGAPE